MYNILQEFNETNSTLDKRKVCEKYKDNKLFLRVFQMANDNVRYTFGITMKNIKYTSEVSYNNEYSLDNALDDLENLFCTRKATGSNALAKLQDMLEHLSKDDAKVLELIINRDLRINFGKREYNKIVSKENKCVSPPYMRCSLPDKLDKINYPAIVQLKADGTYRSLIKDGNNITLMGRSGEKDDFPLFESECLELNDGVYIGELMLRRYSKAADRMKANGLINSDTEQDDMYIQCWDYLTLEEWNNKASSTFYADRFDVVQRFANACSVLEEIPYRVVTSYEVAMDYFKEQVRNGYEGAVLKNMDAPFKDHTSPNQIKLKEEAVAEFIVTGFEEGKGRLEGTLGAMSYKSQDGLVIGKMGGFDDLTRETVWSHRDEILNTIVSVKYNGVTKAKGKDTWSLMFANFVEFRPEKEEADTLEYVKSALK